VVAPASAASGFAASVAREFLATSPDSDLSAWCLVAGFFTNSISCGYSLFRRKQGVVLSKQGIYWPGSSNPLIGRAGRLRTFNAPLAPLHVNQRRRTKNWQTDAPPVLTL
jgi:hypothetical protein